MKKILSMFMVVMLMVLTMMFSPVLPAKMAFAHSGTGVTHAPTINRKGSNIAVYKYSSLTTRLCYVYPDESVIVHSDDNRVHAYSSTYGWIEGYVANADLAYLKNYYAYPTSISFDGDTAMIKTFDVVKVAKFYRSDGQFMGWLYPEDGPSVYYVNQLSTHMHPTNETWLEVEYLCLGAGKTTYMSGSTYKYYVDLGFTSGGTSWGNTTVKLSLDPPWNP